MKNAVLVLVFFLSVSSAIMANNPRTVVSVNESWKFSTGDDTQDVLLSSFDDHAWQLISIPHTWNKEDAADEPEGYYRGIGWYRRTIDIPVEAKERQVFISFEGVNQEAELFVNGKSAGTHVGGYTRFCFNITGLVHVGKPNFFAVKVNNRYNENIPPLTADFTFFGGIYRDVNLIYTEDQHISTTWYASSGVFITTPSVSEKEASVSIKTFITNDDVRSGKVRIENVILSPKGDQLITKTSALKLAPGTTTPSVQENILIGNPQLWSPDSPSLYKVITRLYDSKTNALLDEVINPLGLRWYEFSADKGFFLNGKSIKLIGTNRHQCFLNMGNALSDEMHVRDVKLLKDMGANFLRVSHYPQDHTVMEMCDKLGIICSVEIPIVNGITESEAFTNNCLAMAREMVMQDYNRPSVMIWAYMNEVLLRPPYKDSNKSGHYLKSVTELAARLEAQIRQDDPARYTMIPCHGNFDAYFNAGLLDIPKLIGFNLYQGWYSGTFDGFGKFLDNAKKRVPDKPFIISEYGADVDPRLHSFEPQRFDYSQEYANLYHEAYIKAIMERPFVAGAAIWNLNDFYSEDRANAVPHVNNKGIVSLNRELKDTYLQYKAILSTQPVVAIGGMNWMIRGGEADQQGNCIQPVKVYSNQKTVGLSVNGFNLGFKEVVDHIALFDVPFKNGKNILDAASSTGKGIIRDQLTIDFRSVPFDLKDINHPFTEINVLMGSKRYFEDKTSSVIWIPEKEYTPGTWGYVGGQPYLKRSNFGSQPASDLNIQGTTDDPVYQTMRVGLKAFKMDVPDGKYTITLYWAELQSTADRKALAYNLGNDALKEDFTNRSFDVDINRSNVVKDLDLSKAYGEQRAVIRKFEVDATNGEGITVSFRKGVGEPILNAIRVYRNY